ncbi:hypothetical protein FJW10_10300 [Mesorhizobium sp. B4-1-1]|nr:hypothetical protein FJW10_10300 [Mesorhizobium sp. B4-1-1]
MTFWQIGGIRSIRNVNPCPGVGGKFERCEGTGDNWTGRVPAPDIRVNLDLMHVAQKWKPVWDSDMHKTKEMTRLLGR